ncbi:MAG: hypothetical protein QXS38_02405 [Candidatus Pacearchaeota archaeon]
MKPQFNAEEIVPHQVGAGLTSQSNPSTLDVKGNIFMQEPGNEEVSKKSQEGSQIDKTEYPTESEKGATNGENSIEKGEELVDGGGNQPPKEPPDTATLSEPDDSNNHNNQDQEKESFRDRIKKEYEDRLNRWKFYYESVGRPNEDLAAERALSGDEPPIISPLEAETTEIAGMEASEKEHWERAVEDYKQKLRELTRNGNFDEVEDFLNKNIDLNSGTAGIFIKPTAEVSLNPENIENGMYGYHLEYLMERLLSSADITPSSDYPRFTFQQEENLARITLAARDTDRSEDKSFYRYISELRQKRYVSHELFRSMKNREQYKEVVTRYLRTEGFNFLENEIAGVAVVQRLWEKVLADKVWRRPDWLSEDDFRNAHQEVASLIKAIHSRDPIKKINWIKMPDQHEPIKYERQIRPWEIDRAVIVGRAVAAASQRRTSYGVLGEIPPTGDIQYKSLDSEYIARVLAGRKVIGQRFLAGSSGGSKEYMEKWKKNKRILNEMKGQIYGYESDEVDDKGKKIEKTIYGHNVDSLVLLDTGVPDVKSHSWRSVLMFLKQQEYAVIAPHFSEEGRTETIGEYFDRQMARVKALKKKEDLKRELDRVFSQMSEDQLKKEGEYLNDSKIRLVTKEDRMKNIIFSAYVKEAVLSQRLYLGTIVRNPNLTPYLKAEVWKNVAKYIPSRIAALFPDKRKKIIGDQEWEGLVKKLWVAEELRVDKQAERIRSGGNFDEESLLDHLGEDITLDERNAIEGLMILSEKEADILARMTFPFNPFLDDVPKTGWMNLAEADLERLLISDQDAYNKAINQDITAIIADPVMRLEESAKHLIDAKNSYAIPIGVEGAQAQLEADIMTRYDLYGMKNVAKWYGYAIMKLARYSTSRIEDFNVDANIAMDERATARDIEFLTQHEVVGNDPHHKDAFGTTQQERLKERAKASRIHIWLFYIRLLLALLPAEMARDMGLKTLVPGDLAKSLG